MGVTEELDVGSYLKRLLAFDTLFGGSAHHYRLMPGEWYGGQLHIAPPTDQAGGQKSYTIVITVGQDRHVVDINQGPAGT